MNLSSSSQDPPSPPVPSPSDKFTPLKIPLWYTLPFILLIPALIIILLTGQSIFKEPPSLQPSPTLTPSPTSNPLENWLTYSYPSYSYEIKYPPNWLLSISEPDSSPSPEIISLTSPQETSTLTLYPLTAPPIVNQNLNDWYQQVSTDALFDGAAEIIDRQPITLAGIKGIQLTESFNAQSTVIYLPRSEFILRIIISPAEDIYSNDISKILSTFQFPD